mmetsp:Transcript_20005/g.59079  ORF Transcript_20005/g.59079 Transcript_20005/m.59079 type:complete len:483 (+) Transcript_20005:62-1510(+)
MPKPALKSDTALLNAKNKRIPLGPDSAGKSLVPYVANDSNATQVGAFHYYGSGRMALFENRMYAGNYYWLYADNARNTVLCQFDPLGQGHACFPNGKLRLTSTKRGGTLLDADGSVIKSWTDDKPLKGDAISFAINSIATLTFKDRYSINLKVSLGGQEFAYELGEQLVHGSSNYASKSVGKYNMGPDRGKFIVDVSTIDRDKGKQGAVDISKKTRVTTEDLSITALHSIITDADDMKVRVEGLLAQPWIESSVMPSRNFNSTGNPRDFNKSMDDPQWASFLGKTPASSYTTLPVSRVLQNASGRYRTGTGIKSKRVKLPVIPPRRFDDYVGSEVPQDVVAVVCCLASWLPLCNRTEQWLETLNGELAMDKESAMPPFTLHKFDMSSSRLLRDRYNINTLPMYLMFYGGKLAYASNVLNGYGMGREDMRAQAAATLANAQAGQFLPADFRFGKTDNKLMDNMNDTLKGLAAPKQEQSQGAEP